MVQILTQTHFADSPFNSERVNLHRRAQRSENVALLIHGLNGSGATTWRDIPAQLFGDFGDEPFDVALYDYPTLARRLQSRSASLNFYAQQLSEQLIEFIDEYEMTFLVGHSLGGLLARAVARLYLEHLVSTDTIENNKISGILTVATPLAGTPRAVKPFNRALPELELLGTVAADRQEVDSYLWTKTIAHNMTPHPSGRPIILPHYAITAGFDLAVPQHSSIHGAPTTQQHHLLAGHSNVLEGDEVSKYFRACAAGRRLVLDQQAREARQAQRRPRQPPVDRLPPCHFRLVSDKTSPTWDLLFTKIRREKMDGFRLIDFDLDRESIPLQSLTIFINERETNWRGMLERHATTLQDQAETSPSPVIGAVVLAQSAEGPSEVVKQRLDQILGGRDAYYMCSCHGTDDAAQAIELLWDLARAREDVRRSSLTGNTSTPPVSGLNDERWES